MHLVESLFNKQVNYEDSYESVDLTKEELLQLRKDIVLNSTYLKDYENSLGLDPREVHDFFQGFSEFTEELAEMQGGNPEDYDTEEALLTYYRDFEMEKAFTHYIEESFTDNMEKKCSKCNTPLNDMGTCPVCDDGEEDYEDINRKEDKDKILNEYSLTESIGYNLARSAESIADNLDEFLATISDDPDSINSYLGEDELHDLAIASDILHDTAYALSHED